MTVTQILFLKTLGWIMSTNKKASSLFFLHSILLHMSFPQTEQHSGKANCLFLSHWINHMCHHREPSVWSVGGVGVICAVKMVKRLSVHKCTDVWLRQKKEEWKTIKWWGMTKHRQTQKMESRREAGNRLETMEMGSSKKQWQIYSHISSASLVEAGVIVVCPLVN